MHSNGYLHSSEQLKVQYLTLHYVAIKVAATVIALLSC